MRLRPVLVRPALAAAILVLAVSGCGGKTRLIGSSSSTGSTPTPTAPIPAVGNPPTPTGGGAGQGKLGFPEIATKNTTRVAGSSAVQDAAAVALAVYPSAAPGTHPPAVVLAPENDWQASIAAASLMGQPFRAPLLLSTPGSPPAVTRSALRALAPTGDHSLGGVQVIRIGGVAGGDGLRTGQIGGDNPYELAAAIDRYEAAARGKESVNVVVVSAARPGYAMPAAGWAAESGEPVLFVSRSGVPAPTARALMAHHHPHIYLLGPASVIPDSVVTQLRHYGAVKRIAGSDPAANSVAFAGYRDPPCPAGQPCVHIPHSFGWAIRSPGHGYVLINSADPLDAAAASALSSSGAYGPQLLVENPNTLPKPVLNYFLNYATPGYTQEGPTAAVYNHAWLIGPVSAISMAVQSQVDSLLEVVPQR